MTSQYYNTESREVDNDKGPMLNPQVVHIYFNYLNALMTRLSLHDKPNNIRNGDETGKQFEHQTVRVLAEKGSKSVVGRASPGRTNITIMVCVNAENKCHLCSL